MNHNQHIRGFMIASALVASLGNMVMAGNLPSEPGEEYLINEDVNIITGLYTREYALNDSGKVDYKTARQIVLSEYNEYWNSVVETKEFPLLYWYDANHDGDWDMWVDRKVEGCSCDIQPYHPIVEDSEVMLSQTYN